MNASAPLTEVLMQNRTAAEHVFSLLQREIITGRAKPGQRLVERELTERFGVSRTPVREALGRLVSAHLVVNVPYRGMMVRKLSLDFARDVYDLRLGLEGIAAYFAAERGTPQQHEQLTMIFEKIEALTREGQRDEIMFLNNDFHRLIAAATGNKLLRERIDEVWTTVNLVRGTAWRGNVRSEGSMAEHGAILQAIVRRDAEGARAASELHVRHSWAVVESSLQEQLDQES